MAPVQSLSATILNTLTEFGEKKLKSYSHILIFS